MRPEIQALRGIAVSLVVVCHLWPSALPGGFVGVDVFFAVSGFLITSHLLREVERTGRVALGAFWARRARRILPAALTVLLLIAVTTLAIVPQTDWPQFLAEVRASAAYVQNWQLASSAVDHFASADGPRRCSTSGRCRRREHLPRVAGRAPSRPRSRPRACAAARSPG
jgi:peptidoglycan/LPS O-acetylase OafA/YrhL